MTKRQKKILATSLITPIVAISTICSGSIAIANTIAKNSLYKLNSASQNLNSESSLKFDNAYFENKNDLLKYANEILEVERQSTTVPIKYKIANDLEKNELNSIDELYDFANGKIEIETKNASRNLQTSLNGEIYASDEINFLSDLDAPRVDVYRGKDNSIWSTEEAAKDTYLNIFEPYFFKDIYFRSKEELALWLEQNADQWFFNRVPNSIVLEAPNGQLSMPISYSDIKSGNESAKQAIKDFVRVNSLSNVQLIQTTGGKEEIKYFNEDELDLFKQEFDPTYINVESNGGKGNYIIDSSMYDDGQLNGPYFVTSSSSLKNVSNTQLWRETTNLDRLNVTQYDDITILSKFFDQFLSLSDVTNDSYNIFFTVHDEELSKQLRDYYQLLFEKFPAIYSSLQNIFETISLGKRYSSFYKLPIIFYHTMDQIIYWNAPQYLVDLTREVFINLCDYYDNVLYSSVSKQLLYGTDPKKTLFSFKTFFGIGKMNVDLNTDLEYFITKALEEYKELFKFSKVASTFIAIKNQLGSTYTMPFKLDYFNKIYGLDIDPSNEYAYRLLWYTISTDNYNDMKFVRWRLSTDENSNDFDVNESFNAISPFFYTNFLGQWQKTIVFNEAIRYALTQSKWVYTEEQEDLFESLGFMRYEDPADLDYVLKHSENLEYMQKLYEINNGNIENIFYMIMAMFDKDSKLTLLEYFGEPKLYTDEEYSSKIYDWFYNNILVDTKKFSDYTNSIFTCDIDSVMLQATALGLEINFDDQGIIIDSNRPSYSQQAITPSIYPKPYGTKEIINGDDVTDIEEIIDNPEIKTSILGATGKPILSLRNTENQKYEIVIPNPVKLFESSSITLNKDELLKEEEIKKTIEENIEKNVPNFEKIMNPIQKTKFSSNNKQERFGGPNLGETWRSLWASETANRLHGIVREEEIFIKFKDKVFYSMTDRKRYSEISNQSLSKQIEFVKGAFIREKESYLIYLKNNKKDYKLIKKEVQKARQDLGFKKNKNFIDYQYETKKNYDDSWEGYNEEKSKITSEITNEYKDKISKEENWIKESFEWEKKATDMQEECRQKKLAATTEQEYKYWEECERKDKELAEYYRETREDSKNQIKILEKDRDNKIKLETEKESTKRVNKYDKKQVQINKKYSQKDKDITKKAKKELKANKNVDKQKKVKSRTSKSQKSLKSVGRTVGKVFGTALAIAGAAFAIFEIIMNWHKIEYISYIYECNDFRLIWDGGYRESYFFGLIPGDSRGIEAMKLLEPIKIINPNIESGLYYNGYIYGTERELERAQYQDMVNGLYKPNNVSNAYSFEKITDHKPKNPNYVSTDLDKLSENIYNDLKNAVSSNSTLPSFAKEYGYDLDVGGIYTITSENGYKDLKQAINKLIGQIKPLKLAYIPIIDRDTGFPISREDATDDKSIPNFKLPYKTWNSVQGSIKENNDVPEFVFVNQNEGKYKGISDAEARSTLTQLFREKFNVPKKTTSKKEASNTRFSKFSDLSNQTKRTTIYKVTGAYGDVKKFLDPDDAFNYIWESYGISLEVTLKSFNVYIYNEKVFYSKQEYLNWVFNNTEVIAND